MQPDAMGFRYPVVDTAKCVECGMCERVCSFSDAYATPDNFDEPKPFGVRMKNLDEVMKSRSGGAFAAFSNWVLERDGVVYGAGYDEEFNVCHRRVTTREGRDTLRGSKYVQSDMTDMFRRARKDLLEGRWVLFSGTPCQLAGLHSFVPKRLHERLLTVDIVCHGVPSPAVWSDYKRSLLKRPGMKITGVDFRNKRDFGWRAHKETLTLEDTNTGVRTEHTSDLYTHLFYQHIMLRPSCGECHYCNLRRTGDLTLADFWGWERTGSDLNADDRGLSLVLVNTPKGERIFNDVAGEFNLIRPRMEDCMQGHLKHPTTLNPLSEKFRKEYERHGYRYIARKYGNFTLSYKVRRLAGRVLRKVRRLAGQ